MVIVQASTSFDLYVDHGPNLSTIKATETITTAASWTGAIWETEIKDADPYVPFTAAAAEVSDIAKSLSDDLFAVPSRPIYMNLVGADGSPTTYPTDAAPKTGSVVYYVPYRLPEKVDYNSLSGIVSRIAHQSCKSPSGATCTTTAAATDANKTTSNCADAHATTGTSGTESTATPTGTGSTDTTDGASTSLIGAAVGGSVGGLAFGIVGALIAFAFLRRSKARASGKHAHRSGAGDGNASTGESLVSDEMRTFDTPTTETGWQKHLPQEKDDKRITEAVKTIFEQVRIHVEGFYNSESGKLTSSAAAALELVLPEGLSRKLSEASDRLPILEGILIRWIIHRISLRSDAGDSFLPFEYTKIPEQRGWHMESDGGGSGQVEESKKGFPQAFSQWRVLTSFLLPNPRADHDFKKSLDVKIDQGVRALTDAFAPWDIHGRSIANRNESLRRIFHSCHEVGVLLFAQPSVFVFDWSDKEGTVTVSPTLFKTHDKSATLLPDPSIMIAARRIDL